MNPDTDEASDTFGLLATGTSGCWTVDLDESADGTHWSLQLDGPQLYFVCEIPTLHVVKSVVKYLHSNCNPAEALPLGHFASSAVSFHWDNESPDRCFLIIATNRSALRVTLSPEDTTALTAAFEQILEDLPAESVK